MGQAHGCGGDRVCCEPVNRNDAGDEGHNYLQSEALTFLINEADGGDGRLTPTSGQAAKTKGTTFDKDGFSVAQDKVKNKSEGGFQPISPSPRGTCLDEKTHFLSQVQLFKRLPSSSLPQVSANLRTKRYAAKDVIIKQGDDGDEFFLISSGTATVDIDGNVVAKLKAGDYFGENALLRDEPRTATITAAEGLIAYCMTHDSFHELGLHEKLEFAKRGAVAGGANEDVEIKPPSPKTADQAKLIVSAVKANKNLEFMRLEDSAIQELVELAWKEQVAKGTRIITQGDMNAHYFYIVQDGTFQITVTEGEARGADQAASASVGSLSQGGSFGELALLYRAPRAATVTAETDAVVWVIARPHFKEVFAKAADAHINEYIEHLGTVEITNKLTSEQKIKVARSLEEMTFLKGDIIFKQGEKGEIFYILVAGQIEIAQSSKVISSPKAPVAFGEKALESNEPRAATVKVLSEKATCLMLDKISFDILLERHKHTPQQRRFGTIKRKDLKKIGLLGCGGFGAVELVEHAGTDDTYALKILSKGYVVKSGMQASVVSEKNVQLMCDSAFVVKLYETYNGEHSLYLLLELALGGELYATYNKKGFFGKVPHAKFYVAGTVFAFDHLHSHKIIFRDLKPENLLLSEEGKVKLTDMGLAKVVVGKTFTTCGTPDYFAPEIIASTGHNKAVDWWTLGILNYELLAGHPPFESATPTKIYNKIAKGINAVAFPKSCRGPVEDLIKGLCHNEPIERLPMKKGDIVNIKNHAWYDGFDWNAMFKLEMTPPYKPAVKSKKDLANFAARKEDMPPQIPYKDPKTGWDKDFATSD